jgi:hypothetical protein
MIIPFRQYPKVKLLSPLFITPLGKEDIHPRGKLMGNSV